MADANADRLPPEARARQNIDRMLLAAGWTLQDAKDANPGTSLGVAVREHVLDPPHGRVDYLLYVEGVPVGTVEAKPEGKPLVGVEWQNSKYSTGVPDSLGAPVKPLAFLYESTGTETQFTNTLDPKPRSRNTFWFHRPETFRGWIDEYKRDSASATLRWRLQHMPEVDAADLWPPKDQAVRNLEESLALNRPRALIQMATGAGKSKLAAFITYRLAKFAKAQRILFLVDRATLGRQAQKEFQQFVVPDDQRKFSELYITQRLSSERIDTSAKVCVSTIQRLYSILRGDPISAEDDESSPDDPESLHRQPVPIDYNPSVPIEMFDLVIVDECHRSIYGSWLPVLEYFDAFIVGLTATPTAQTFGFFNRNVVMEYSYEDAVADKINVDFDVYRIKTKITEQGSEIDAGFTVGYRNRTTRRVRWATEDEPIKYGGSELDRAVVSHDQMRTVIRAFKDALPELFPGRTHVPKTLIFAKDDSHADDLVRMIREVFDEGNAFCQKITCQTTGNTEDLISAFRNEYFPRIAVTVDMIATGTDIRPLEVVMFMRMVRSRTYFEQMRGRGVRVIHPDDLRIVTPDADAKTRFVLVDAVGVTETELVDHQPLERRHSLSFADLLAALAVGNRDEDLVASLASRLTRLDRQITDADRTEVEAVAGRSLTDMVHCLIEAVDPDVQRAAAERTTGKDDPSTDEIAAATAILIEDAVRFIAQDERLREKLLEVRKSYEQTIDKVSEDSIVEQGFSKDATDRAKKTVESFREFIELHKDEITALEVLYSVPSSRRLSLRDVRELANAIGRPPYRWTPEELWSAYERLDASKVRGSGGRVLTDLVSLVRYTLNQQDELVAYPQTVRQRFSAWLVQQDRLGKTFTHEQAWWLEQIAGHIGTSLGISEEDFDLVPFGEAGGLGKAYSVFGEDLERLLVELNEALAA